MISEGIRDRKRREGWPKKKGAPGKSHTAYGGSRKRASLEDMCLMLAEEAQSRGEGVKGKIGAQWGLEHKPILTPCCLNESSHEQPGESKPKVQLAM